MILLEIGGQSQFPLYSASGAPTGQYAEYHYESGNGPVPKMFDGGQLPREEGTIDLGGGWSITTKIYKMQVLKRA